MRKQTLEEVVAIKRHLQQELSPDKFSVVARLDDGTQLTEVSSGKSFTCVEVQLKGCLIESGLRRRYVSYNELENYEVV